MSYSIAQVRYRSSGPDSHSKDPTCLEKAQQLRKINEGANISKSGQRSDLTYQGPLLFLRYQSN